VAVALGVTLAALYLRGQPMPGLALVHGCVGFAGFGLLVLTLQGPRRGDAMGAGSFGIVASVLLGLALAFGPFIPLLNRRAPRIGGIVIAAHAGLAITAFVLFLAWISFG
jgi:hypothetical protein